MDAMNFSPILKGKSDIFFIKNGDKINQAVLLLFIKFRGHAVLTLQPGKEPLCQPVNLAWYSVSSQGRHGRSPSRTALDNSHPIQ